MEPPECNKGSGVQEAQVLDDPLESGVRLERERIVAWLHEGADAANRAGKYAEEWLINQIALAVERGEHEKDNK